MHDVPVYTLEAACYSDALLAPVAIFSGLGVLGVAGLLFLAFGPK